ncbi:unnamed protein product [Coffea canephora]|uniref:Fe2OG dioxygenase domain-containing protein n=1 Tax=Coffea canephora TaxID=49390 RepID=A0A068USM5_COFCA|nr:unnamed protein product [Coffea canephora]
MNTSFLDEALEGYVCNTHKDYQTIGWTERLYLHVPPESISNFQKWPQKPENFRRVLLEYTEKLRVLNEIILKAMAKSLNLDENCFLHQFGGNQRLLSTFNFYPPCPWPDVLDANKPHSDPSGITFILQDDEVEGLQVLKKNQWHTTPLAPDAIVVNVGDQVEIMSNGIFKSPIHRVPTNNKRERISLAFFFCPEPSFGEIKPAEGLIDEKNPRLYKNVIDYLRHFRENIQHGITRPLDALKI